MWYIPGFPGMGNTLKIWKIGKYWEILDKKYLILLFLTLKRMFYYDTVLFKICYKMIHIGTLFKIKMKAASL